MDNAADFWMSSEHSVQRGLVRHVDLVEFGSPAAEELDAIEGHFGGIVKTVDNHHVVVMLEESEGRERPNVPGPSRRRSISICR